MPSTTRFWDTSKASGFWIKPFRPARRSSLTMVSMATTGIPRGGRRCCQRRSRGASARTIRLLHLEGNGRGVPPMEKMLGEGFGGEFGRALIFYALTCHDSLLNHMRNWMQACTLIYLTCLSQCVKVVRAIIYVAASAELNFLLRRSFISLSIQRDAK